MHVLIPPPSPPNPPPQSGFVRTQLLATACACSFGAVFGAPIGGVIFSVEVTQTYFLVSNLWKGFFVAIFATIPVVMSPGKDDPPPIFLNLLCVHVVSHLEGHLSLSLSLSLSMCVCVCAQDPLVRLVV